MVELSIEDLGGKADRFFGGDGPVGPNLQGQLVIVGNLFHPGIFHAVVHLQHRGVDAIHKNRSHRRLVPVHLLVAVRGDIALALLEHQLHGELRPFRQGGNVHTGVQHLHLGGSGDGASGDLAFALCGNLHPHGFVAVELGGQSLDVQDDLGDVLLHTGDGGELVLDAIDLHGRHGHARKRGEQHPSQAVA